MYARTKRSKKKVPDTRGGSDQRQFFICKEEKARLIKKCKEYALVHPHPIFQKALPFFIRLLPLELWLSETGKFQFK